MDFRNIKTVGIIGAGVAGLATAKTLKAIGVECTIFERNSELGGVWTDGYLDYGVQVQKELYEFPDFPLPKDSPTFTPGPMLQQYLEDYARHFDITGCINFDTVVEKAEPVPGKDGWTLTLSHGGKTQEKTFDLVVVCVGLYSNIPHMPDLPGRQDFTGNIHHIQDLKTPDILTGRRVTVLGFGKSATDAAQLANRHADAAHIIARTLHWPVPRKLAGILPFKWGLLNRLTLTVVPPYKSPTALERRVHGLGKPLVWLYWRVVELLLAVQCKLWSQFGTRPSLVPDEPAEIGAFSEATMVPRPAFFKAVRAGDITLHRGGIRRLTASGIELENGENIDSDTLICATGWRSDYSFLSKDMQQRLGFGDDGVYLYRQILHPAAPGLAFIGYASTVSNILAYCMQARWLAELIAGRLELPDAAAQEAEIGKLKAWKQSWIPFSHARAARLIVHLQHYLDELMTDIGGNPLRKTGPFAPLAEVFAPYQPSDYTEVVRDGWRPEGRDT